MLKWAGALAAVGVIGVGLGFGGDLLIRPNTNSTSTQSATATQIETSTKLSTETATQTATVTQTATETATQTATAIRTSTVSQISTVTPPPQTITSTITVSSTSSTNTPAPGTWINTIAGTEITPVRIRVLNGVALELRAQDGIPYWNRKLETRTYAELDALYKPDKLQYPMKRVGARGQGKFVRTTWDDVLGTIANQMKTYSTAGHPEYFALLNSANAASSYAKHFLYAYGSPNYFASDGSYCTPDGAVASTLTTGGSEGTDDWASAKYALLINTKLRTRALGLGGGANPDRLAAALQNGVKMVTVLSNLDAISYVNGSEWVPIRPGTDAAFLMGLMNQIVTDKGYDLGFLQMYTNAAILIQPSGAPLKGSSGKYQVWDLSTSSVRDIDAAGTVTGSPALTGSYSVNISTFQGTCKTAFQLFTERLQSYTPALVSTMTDVPAAKIVEIAKDLETYKPAVVITDATNPSARWTNALQNKRALKILPMLLGTHDKLGGRYYTYSSGNGISTKSSGYPVSSTISFPLSMPPKYSSSSALVQARVDYDPNLQGQQFTGNGNSQNLKNAILTGKPYPIKMLFIQGETPMSSSPPSTLWKQCYTSSNLDLIVYAGIWYENDCDYADIILPEAQAMERPMGYNGFSTITVDNPDNVHQEFSFLAAANQVVQPSGDVQDCTQYMTTIANLAGFGQYFAFKFDDYLSWQLSPMGITIQQLRQSGVFYPTPLVTKQVVYGKTTSWPTDSGRLNLYSPTMATLFLTQGGPYYQDPHLDPLPLLVPLTRPLAANEFYLYGGMHFLHRQRKTEGSPHLTELYLDGEVRQASLWINSSRAATLGIKDKDKVVLSSALTGVSTTLSAKVTDGIHPSLVHIYTGFGRTASGMDPNSRARQGANDADFCPVNYSPYTGGGAREEAPVAVTKAST